MKSGFLSITFSNSYFIVGASQFKFSKMLGPA